MCTWLVLRVPRQYISTQTGLLGQAEMADGLGPGLGVDLRCPGLLITHKDPDVGSRVLTLWGSSFNDGTTQTARDPLILRVLTLDRQTRVSPVQLEVPITLICHHWVYKFRQ